MLRLLSSKSTVLLDLRKPSKTCHVAIHWIACAGYSQMSTHVPGIQSFFKRFFALSLFPKLTSSSIRVKTSTWYCCLDYNTFDNNLGIEINTTKSRVLWTPRSPSVSACGTDYTRSVYQQNPTLSSQRHSEKSIVKSSGKASSNDHLTSGIIIIARFLELQ